MEDLVTGNKGQHKLALAGRKSCSLTGIVDAISFDVSEVLLETDIGMLIGKRQQLILIGQVFYRQLIKLTQLLIIV